MLINPLIGWLVLTALDTWDYGFSIKAGFTFEKYQYLDKSLDFWFRIFMLVSAWFLMWPDLWIFVVLFMIRFVGELLFLLTKKEITLLFFPNIIHYFYPLYAIYFVLLKDKYDNNVVLLIIFLLAALPKLFLEYRLHYKKDIDPISTGFLKESNLTDRKIT